MELKTMEQTMTESRRMRVLEALHGKWEKDHGGGTLKYPSKYCYSETKDGKRSRISDEDFGTLAERFSSEGVNEAVDGLKADGLVELFDSGLDIAEEKHHA
jgi:hypothetical protein